MTAIPMLLFNEQLLFEINAGYWGQWLLLVAAVLTVWSMIYYLRKAWPLIKEHAGHLS